MNNAVFGKTMENVKDLRAIKLVTTERRRIYLVLKKPQILMNKPIHLVLSKLDLSKIFMYKFWYDYLKAKYGENESFVVWIQTILLFM